jgi:hypothetical protein
MNPQRRMASASRGEYLQLVKAALERRRRQEATAADCSEFSRREKECPEARTSKLGEKVTISHLDLTSPHGCSIVVVDARCHNLI